MASKWLVSFRQDESGCFDVATPVPKCQKRQKGAAGAFRQIRHFGTAKSEKSGSADPLPADWIEGVSLLPTIARPACIRAPRWQQIIADADRFLGDWAAKASALGWKTIDVFGAHPTHPIQRLDCAGLILLLRGDELLAMTAETARIRTRTGAVMTYYRRPQPSAVPLWALA